MNIFVGVHCGGSTTIAIAGTPANNIIGRGTAGRQNPLSVGVDQNSQKYSFRHTRCNPHAKKPDFGTIYGGGTAGGKQTVINEGNGQRQQSTHLRTADSIQADQNLRSGFSAGLPTGNGIVLFAGTAAVPPVEEVCLMETIQSLIHSHTTCIGKCNV